MNKDSFETEKVMEFEELKRVGPCVKPNREPTPYRKGYAV